MTTAENIFSAILRLIYATNCHKILFFNSKKPNMQINKFSITTFLKIIHNYGNVSYQINSTSLLMTIVRHIYTQEYKKKSDFLFCFLHFFSLFSSFFFRFYHHASDCFRLKTIFFCSFV